MRLTASCKQHTALASKDSIDWGLACRQRLLANADKKKGMVTDVAFKRPSPMKKSACVSDYYGTFGGKVEYIPVRSHLGSHSLTRFSPIALTSLHSAHAGVAGG